MSEMNPDDRKRFDKMEETFEIMQNDIKEIKDAFLGNKLLGDKGFKGQIETLNVKIDLQQKEIESLKSERTKNEVYILIIKSLFLLLASSVIALIFKKF